jgi:hypothetical protein
MCRPRRLLLLLASLCCCFLPGAVAAAVLDCPATRVKIEDTSSPTTVDLQPNSSYELGPGVFVLNGTVEALRRLCAVVRCTVPHRSTAYVCWKNAYADTPPP